MASISIEPFLKGDTSRNTRGLLRLIILCTIAAAAVSSRLFSVISMFHHLIEHYEQEEVLNEVSRIEHGTYADTLLAL